MHTGTTLRYLRLPAVLFCFALISACGGSGSSSSHETDSSNDNDGGNSDTSAPDSNTAASCFIPLGRPGDQLERLYHTRFADGIEVENSELAQNLGSVIFNDQEVTRILITNITKRVISGDAVIPPDLETEHYWSEPDALVRFDHGMETATMFGTAITRYTPPIAWEYDLSPGDIYEQINTVTTEVPGSQGVTIQEQTVHYTVHYLGRETLSTPSGTVETCVFDRQDQQSDLVQTLWHGVGGLGLIKQTSNHNPIEILTLSVTINGDTVFP